jgi:small conductance mechanosensitive channel
VPTLPQSERLVEMAFRLALTVGVAAAFQWLLFLVIGRIERFLIRAGHGSHHSEQRAKTLGGIFRSLATVVVAVAALIHALEILGWDVKPLLAGAGIVGVALGFGAQTLVRDVIAGFFILAEDQFAVGDVIEVGGKAAAVEAITVRCTTLRDFHGYVHFVPNGEMKIVTNRSRGWNRGALDVVVAASEDVDRALAVCRSVAEEFNADPRWRERLLDPVEVWGIESVDGQAIHVRLVLRTRPGADLPEATRELRRRAYRALLEAGVRNTFQPLAAAPDRTATAGATDAPTGGI